MQVRRCQLKFGGQASCLESQGEELFMSEKEKKGKKQPRQQKRAIAMLGLDAHTEKGQKSG